MIKDTQEYLQHWEKENNPFYPSEMRWDRLQVNRFLKDYKKQLTISDVVKQSEQFFCCKNQIKRRCGEQCLGCYVYANDKV